MKEMGIAIIGKNNIMRSQYEKKIGFWDSEGNFTPKIKDKPIVGLFYNNHFLAASIMEINEELEASIITINGSTVHKEEIEEYFQEALRTLALQSGATNMKVMMQSENKESPKVKRYI